MKKEIKQLSTIYLQEEKTGVIKLWTETSGGVISDIILSELKTFHKNFSERIQLNSVKRNVCNIYRNPIDISSGKNFVKQSYHYRSTGMLFTRV